jgi:HK97 family phage major capsid protein
MNATLKKRYEESKVDVQKLWAQFGEEKKRVEDDGAKAEDIDKLQSEFYEPYLKAVEEHSKNEEAYRKAVEMEAGPKFNGNGPDPDEHDGDKTDEAQTPGDRVVLSAQYKAMRAAWDPASESARPHLSAIKVLDNTELKTLLQSAGAPGTQFLRNIRLPGVLPLIRQPVQLIQLVRTREVSEGNTVEWVRHSATTNNAAEVAEASATTGATGTKPESAVTFVVENTPLRMIAHWIPATRQALADMPMLRGIVDDELVEGVRRRVNTQILSGDGIAPNLTGILTTVGIGTQPIGADTRPDAVFKAITTIRTAFFEPTAIVMHPSDWQDFRLTKDTTNNYLFGPVYGVGEDTLWGLRVVIDTTITAGTALVGDFSQAVLYVRDGVSVLTSDSHSDFFVRNMIVILAEGRYGFAVERPTAFATVTGI